MVQLGVPQLDPREVGEVAHLVAGDRVLGRVGHGLILGSSDGHPTYRADLCQTATKTARPRLP